MTTGMSEEQVYEEARKRVKAKKDFWGNFGAWAGVNLVLIVIWALSGMGYPWFVWPEDKNLGEDTEFCLRVNHKGFGPIMARGDLRCGHYKTVDMAFMVDFKTQRVVEKEVEYAR